MDSTKKRGYIVSAEAKGREEGMEKRILDIDKKMLEDNFDIEVIAKITGLSLAQIKALKQ